LRKSEAEWIFDLEREYYTQELKDEDEGKDDMEVDEEDEK